MIRPSDGDSPAAAALAAATNAVLRVLTTAKNPRTVLGRHRPTAIAYHAAREAVIAYQRAGGPRLIDPDRPAGENGE